jgi:cell division protein FtsB
MPQETRLEQSWRMTLKIWIDRFQQAQRVIRELEDENEVLRERIAMLEREAKP